MVFRGGFHVGKTGGKSLEQTTFVAHQQQRRGLGDPQQFLGIQRDRISPVKTLHQPRRCGREGKHAADRCIHMQPDAVTGTQIRDQRQWIHSTTHGGSSGGHHSKAAPATGIE